MSQQEMTLQEFLKLSKEEQEKRHYTYEGKFFLITIISTEVSR